MRVIGQGMYMQQQRPRNWGELPMGATLGDELGGVGYIGADGSTTENTEKTESKDAPEPKRVPDDILGMPKNVAIGLGVVLLAVGGYFLYKKVINKSI